MEKETVMYRYIAVQRTGTDKIAKGAKVAFESEREVEESTGFSFRKEIASACREQLGIEIAQNEEATVGTTFDVYSEARYAQIREKEEAEAEKRREKEAAEEEKRQLKEAEKRRKEMEKAEAAAKKANRSGKNSSRSKKGKTILGGFSLRNWRNLLKFIVGIVVVVWFISSSLKECSWDNLLNDIKGKTEEITQPKKTSTTTKKKTTTRKSTTTTAKKKSTSTKKKSSTASSAKKSTTSKRKKTTKPRKKSTTAN